MPESNGNPRAIMLFSLDWMRQEEKKEIMPL
jgi:hypothetical protein